MISRLIFMYRRRHPTNTICLLLLTVFHRRCIIVTFSIIVICIHPPSLIHVLNISSSFTYDTFAFAIALDLLKVTGVPHKDKDGQ
jgi:hypothetical protein